MRYLLDTNIISEPFKLDPEPRIIAKLQTHSDDMAIAAVTWHELNDGFHRMPSSRRKQQLEINLNQTVRPSQPILPYNEARTHNRHPRTER